MLLGDRLRALFAPTPQPEPEKAPSGEVAWSESLLYARSDWPKYNPDALMGMHGYKVYRKMMTDEQVKAVVRFKRDAITGRRWYFEYDKEDLKDAERTDAAPNSDSDRDSENVDDPATSGGRVRYAHFKAAPVIGGDAVVGDDTGNDEDEELDSPGAVEKEGGLSDEQALRIRVFEQICYQVEGTFADKLNGILTAMVNGFSVTEKVFADIEVAGKTWAGLRDLKLKPFETFSFHPDEFGNVVRVTQKWEGREQTINDFDERFVHHVQNPDVDPHYGQSELREAYRAWFSKDMTIRFWNIFNERMASGFVWVQPKEGQEIRNGSVEHTQLQTALNTFSSKTSLIFTRPLDFHVEMPKSTDQYERAVASHDKAIAKALLVPNLLGITEQGDTGSYSQSQTQLEAFLWTLEAEARRVEETLNEQIFKPLGELNFGAGPYPRFRFKPLSESLKIQIIRLWKELVQTKAVTATDSDEDHLRELLDFPDKGEPLANTAVNPIKGLPMNAGGMPDAQTEEIDSGNSPANAAAARRTPVGRSKDSAANAQAFGARGKTRAVFVERAVKRVDFAVIDNRGTQITGVAATKMAAALRDGAEEIKQFIRDNDLLKNPDKVEEIEIPRKFINRVRKIAELALKDAWDLGGQHARREIEKARGARFAVDELRLRDDAARKFLEARSATIAADLSDNARKKVTTVLFNGIKNGWTIDEILNRVDDELGATVLPHAGTAIRTTVFEAINEARYDLFASPEMDGFVEALEFSAIIDGKTTEVCEHMDGKVYPVGDQIWEAYTPPLHFNCRSLLIAVTVRDTWNRSTNPKVEPADGFGGA